MNVNFNEFIFFKNIILISLICFIYMLYLLHGITSKEMPKMPPAQTIAPNSTPWQLPCLRRIFLRGMLLWLSGSMRSWWSSGESEWPWGSLLWGRLLSTIPERGFFFAQKYNISYLLFIYLGFIISLLVISPSIIYNHKKREDTHMSSLISILLENAYLSILYIY